jgi:flagellar biogenesis protein FliO
MRTIESLSLPHRCRVHLVEIEGRQLVVATDAGGVKSMTVLPDRFAALMDHSDGEAAAANPEIGRQETGIGTSWSALRESRTV